MYFCLECNLVFEEGQEKRWIENHNLDTPPYEEYLGCPSCSGVYVEAVQCDICENYVTETYIKTKDNQTICNDCYKEHEILY